MVIHPNTYSRLAATYLVVWALSHLSEHIQGISRIAMAEPPVLMAHHFIHSAASPKALVFLLGCAKQISNHRLMLRYRLLKYSQ
ncbi:hypothetical protein PISMIDRAFT_272132 [Pisolithus microcarpus 441]|uniref:Uncharacterized protein n=1 Tax=Pisolithus microcarpus 441 TaxID=765257 RepID=A0A0C9ZVR4_9AGAM|nr:hypothetical protein PISMIDRAFT_272132 [Pisolithus microcarpus 441]